MHCKGVTELCSEVAEYEALLEEFERTAKELEETLKDLEWRKPDVEAEEATLKELRRQAKTDPTVDVASQAIVVRVLRDVLNDKLAEADALEQRLLLLRDQIEALQRELSETGEEEPRGEAVREEA